MEEEELAEFSSLSDDAGEISKHDLIVQTKKSSFWKGNLDLKSKPSGHSTKVCWEHRILTETNTETFFRDQYDPIMLQKVGWFGGHTWRNFFGGIRKMWTNWKTKIWPFQSSKVIPWYQGKVENSVLEGLMTHNPYNTYEILFARQAEGINTAMNVRNMFCYAELCHLSGRH